jgi:hypothetical protein
MYAFFFGVVVTTTLCLVAPFVESLANMPRSMPKYNDGTEYALRNTDIDNILKQNREYVAAMGQEFFDDLGSKHKPKYMWIGCADARAPANELMVRLSFRSTRTRTRSSLRHFENHPLPTLTQHLPSFTSPTG